MAENRQRVYWLSSLLFIVSGGTGLAYEVIWFKRFAHVWGSSTLAISAVVASFLFGLGLGAHLFGRIADRSRRPLWWYGVCEIAIGLLAVVIPWEIAALRSLSSLLYPILQDYAGARFALRFLLTFVVLGPPCVLMGGTLPLLIRRFTAPAAGLKESAGWFYAVNTLGAAAGCYLAGFYLLPTLGLYWTNYLTAAINGAVGLAALRLARGLPERAQPSIEKRDTTPAPQFAESIGDPALALGKLYFATAFSGLAALILEIVWTRQLALLLGGSTYAFTAMLFVVLVGIGLGSLVFHLWLRRRPKLAYAPSIAILALVVAASAGKAAIPQLTLLMGLIPPLRSSVSFNAITCVAISAVLQLVPAVVMGMLFPLFVHLTRKRADEAGRAVGNVYAWNTLGSLAGASVTSAVFIPLVGIPMTLALALAIYVAISIVLFPAVSGSDRLARGMSAAIGCLAVLVAALPQDPRITNSGIPLDGYEPAQALAARTNLFFKEGAAFNVLVTEVDNHRALRINGKVDATNGGNPSMKEDLYTQFGLAYFPRFLNPGARHVLVIGLGSGATAGASLLFPGTHVTCCEIEPAVVEAMTHFADVNHRPERSPRLRMVLDDGRNYLQGTREQFDLIVSEPSNPWMAGVGNLFTREFYLAAKARLNPGGIMAQWIQTYQISTAEYALIVRTVLGVFPYCALLRMSEGDTILLASASPIGLTRRSIEAAQRLVDENRQIEQDLEHVFSTTDVASLLLQYLILDEAGLRRLAQREGSQTINTDLNLRLEFDAPLRLFEPIDPADNAEVHIVDAAGAAWQVGAFGRWGCSREQLAALQRLVTLLTERQNSAAALEITEMALQVDPGEPFFLATHLILAPEGSMAAFQRAVSQIVPLSQQQARRVGVAMWQSRQYQKAVVAFESILQHNPNSAFAWTNLAVNYQALGQREQAAAAYRKALELDPLNPYAQDAYRQFQSEQAESGR